MAHAFNPTQNLYCLSLSGRMLSCRCETLISIPTFPREKSTRCSLLKEQKKDVGHDLGDMPDLLVPSDAADPHATFRSVLPRSCATTPSLCLKELTQHPHPYRHTSKKENVKHHRTIIFTHVKSDTGICTWQSYGNMDDGDRRVLGL